MFIVSVWAFWLCSFLGLLNFTFMTFYFFLINQPAKQPTHHSTNQYQGSSLSQKLKKQNDKLFSKPKGFQNKKGYRLLIPQIWKTGEYRCSLRWYLSRHLRNPVWFFRVLIKNSLKKVFRDAHFGDIVAKISYLFQFHSCSLINIILL